MSKKYKDGRDDTPNKPNAGGTSRQDKAAFDRKHGRNTAIPGTGGGIANEHSDKKAFERARKHEPKPAKGARYSDGSTSTKCN